MNERLATLGAVVGALVTTATPGHADLRFAIGNDTFSELTPPYDDFGFTNDLELAFWRPVRLAGDPVQIGGRVLHRWIVESPHVNAGRRTDLLELVATGERTFGQPRTAELTIGARIGPVITGNTGGRWGQNAFHALCRCGMLLADGLATDYERGRELGALVGGRAHASSGVPGYADSPLRAYSTLDVQGSVGTGVSFVEGAVGIRAVHRFTRTELSAHGELVAARFAVHDERLALPGAYGAGWVGTWRVGAAVSRGRVRVDYQWRANEGGSGEPFGIFAITIKQAGTAF